MTEDSKPKERLTIAKLDAEIKDMQEFVAEEIGQELYNLKVRIEAIEQYREARDTIDAAMADQMTAIEKDTGEVAGAVQDLVAGMMEGGEETAAPEPTTIYTDIAEQDTPDELFGYATIVSACRGLHDILALAEMIRGDNDLSIVQKEEITKSACNAAGIDCSIQLLHRAGA